MELDQQKVYMLSNFIIGLNAIHDLDPRLEHECGGRLLHCLMIIMSDFDAGFTVAIKGFNVLVSQPRHWADVQSVFYKCFEGFTQNAS